VVSSESQADRPNGGSGAVGGVIRTVGLTKVYAGADFRAVDGLNLSVAGGEIFGLLGPNGAGKTTTAGMLTTRVIPTSGQAFVGGIDVVAHPSLAKQILGIVSQQNTLDRQLTVWENLYFHGRLFGIGARESRRVADQLLEQFQLSSWAKASIYALSGGSVMITERLGRLWRLPGHERRPGFRESQREMLASFLTWIAKLLPSPTPSSDPNPLISRPSLTPMRGILRRRGRSVFLPKSRCF